MSLFKGKWVWPVVLGILFTSQAVLAQEKKEERVTGAKKKVAIVNGTPIYDEELQAVVEQNKKRLAMMKQVPSEAELVAMEKDSLKMLIERVLLIQEGYKHGIEVPAEAVAKKVEEIKSTYPDEATFKKLLQLRDTTLEELEKAIRDNLVLQALVEKEVEADIGISAEEGKEYYQKNQHVFKQPEQVRVRHILIKHEDKDNKEEDARAKEKINDVQDKLKEGADFASMAQEFSQCPSGAKGGDLGYFSRGQMVKPFEEEAFSMEQDEVSDIVETRFGYHLLKMMDKKEERIVPFIEVEERIKNALKAQKTHSALQKYVDKLKEGAAIEVLSAQ